MQVAFPLSPIEYRRRTPEQEVLYEVLRAYNSVYNRGLALTYDNSGKHLIIP
jgi:hypothetical protein